VRSEATKDILFIIVVDCKLLSLRFRPRSLRSSQSHLPSTQPGYSVSPMILVEASALAWRRNMLARRNVEAFTVLLI